MTTQKDPIIGGDGNWTTGFKDCTPEAQSYRLDRAIETILENAHVLTCFNCGETLESQTSGIANDTRAGILHIDPGEHNYPGEPDIPASAYFECIKCYESSGYDE